MKRSTVLLPAIVGVLTASVSHAAIVAPYAVDSDTLHLWHFDKDATAGASNSQDAVPGGVAVGNQSGATWGNASFTGFDRAGDTSAASSSIIRSSVSTLRPPPASADGAFTYEAILKISTTSGSQQIFALDQNGSLASRPFWFRIVNGDLQFKDIGNGNYNIDATIPTSGPDAFVANEWFHAAVTYDGNENTANNLKLYWTRVDETRTQANLLGSGILQADLTGTAVYGIGNAYRTVGGGVAANLEGSIDEVRISGIARGAADMLFAVPELSSMVLLSLGWVAFLFQRRRH